jgi:chemotaxis protein methyltransferase CheR
VNTLEPKDDLQTLEIELLLEGVFRRYGYDFREYAGASLRRRIGHALRAEGVTTVSGLQERVLHDPACGERVLRALTVNATSMFRDPGFFLAFRNKVVPLLRTYPSLRIWHAGCSTGEEVYSMAITLREEGLYDRCLIYATDMNEQALDQAREGRFPLDATEKDAGHYLRAGGTKRLSDYYERAGGSALFQSSLKENMAFCLHNLTMDRSFNEFNVILCRNVLIYFKHPLQQRVYRLLDESLARFGILGLGQKESLPLIPRERYYEPLDPEWKLYRRVR